MSRRAIACGVMAIAIASGLTACASSPEPSAPVGEEVREVRVAAAADLKFALEDIVGLVEAAHPDIRVTTTFGSSGTFLSQISNGAPFDLFLSADLGYPRQLVADGLADEAELFPYAVGRLVLWTGEGSAIDPAEGLTVLAAPAVRSVAIANPEHAPYGAAAVAALQGAGVYERVRSKLVFGENVAQAAEFVQSGNADVGIVALSLVLSDPLADVGTWVEVPLESYPRLDQGGVVLDSAQDPGAARAVRDMILSPEGTAVMAGYGFALPED